MARAGVCVSVSLLAVLAAGPAAGQITSRVSISSSGTQGNGFSYTSSISADGRYVAFGSLATNLAAGAAVFGNVYVHDHQTGITELVSVGLGGAPPDRMSASPAISADGRYVAFRSDATNLVFGDANQRRDVFVRDRQSGLIELVSLSTGGVQGDEDSDFSAISADGRFVAFDSYATTFAPPPGVPFNPRVYVRDRLMGTTALVSVSTGGSQASSISGKPSISADGRYVSFFSDGINLVFGDTNGVRDVFVRDLQAGTTEIVSVSSGGALGNASAGTGGSFAPLSADGRYVAFYSTANNLVPGDTNGGDIFLRDRQSGTTERVSVSTGGEQANLETRLPAISADGLHVAFASRASNLVPGSVNGIDEDVFVRDLQTGTTEIASVSTGGVHGNLGSSWPSISADGGIIAFDGAASNLVPGDTNGGGDAFVRVRGTLPVAFCSGDGSGTACPCGNAGAAGNGCASSLNVAGANLAWSGTSSISTDTFVLRGTGMPDSSALYFQGTAQAAGGAGVLFGDGLRCVSGTIIRLGTQVNVGGASQYPALFGTPVSVRGLVTVPGTRTYQVWYRNAASFCTAFTFNLTNGLQAVWQP